MRIVYKLFAATKFWFGLQNNRTLNNALWKHAAYRGRQQVQYRDVCSSSGLSNKNIVTAASDQPIIVSNSTEVTWIFYNAKLAWKIEKVWIWKYVGQICLLESQIDRTATICYRVARQHLSFKRQYPTLRIEYTIGCYMYVDIKEAVIILQINVWLFSEHLTIFLNVSKL